MFPLWSQKMQVADPVASCPSIDAWLTIQIYLQMRLRLARASTRSKARTEREKANIPKAGYPQSPESR